MSTLTNAIVNHDLKQIAETLKSNPEQASERHVGWLPIEWAERCGNVFTLSRTARLLRLRPRSISPEVLLQSYFADVTYTEYETIPLDDAVRMVWGSVFQQEYYEVDRWKRPLIACEEVALDIRYLLELTGITSAEELARLIGIKLKP